MSVSFYLGNLKDGVTTIDFVKDPNIKMSNSKARMVLTALGILNADDLCGQMDRVQFANLCASWLQQHIGKQSAKFEDSVTRGTFGATFIEYIRVGLTGLPGTPRSVTATGADDRVGVLQDLDVAVHADHESMGL